MRGALRHLYAYLRPLLLGLVIGGALLAFLAVGTERQLASLRGVVDARELVQLEISARGILIQTLAGVLVLVGLIILARSVEISQERNVTDRFTRAIDQLGSERLEICLGGIYALERIANESEKDHWPIVEILTAFVRENAPRQDQAGPPRPLPGQIQAALTVLGRRKREFEESDAYRLDLSQTDLRQANLRGAHLERTSLVLAQLGKADLSGARLDGAYLTWADLSGAFLKGTHLEGADLSEACLDGADLTGSHLEGASLLGAVGLTDDQLKRASTNGKTLLPERPQPDGTARPT